MSAGCHIYSNCEVPLTTRNVALIVVTDVHLLFVSPPPSSKRECLFCAFCIRCSVYHCLLQSSDSIPVSY
jgi:hypothetical protein